MSKLRGRMRLIALGGLAVLAAGCIPFFPGGASLAVKAVPNSANVNMVWTSAVDQDAGDGIDYYAIYVDNQYSAYVFAPASNCTLTGLKSSTSYNLMVTAVSLNEEWSGQLGGSLGRVQTTFTTPPGTSAGGPISCTNASSGAPDGDGDRLPDWTETNNGVFTNIASTGTSPTNADTDGDRIKDGDETLGTLAGLYLPAFGTNPLKKNILIEFDWFDDATNCSAHSHRPTTTAVNRLKAAFASANVPNPNGTTGIDLIADYGQGGVTLDGRLVADADGNVNIAYDGSGFGGAEFLNLKAANFASNRNGYFHYMLFAHTYNGTNSSGISELPGDDFIVSMSPCLNWGGAPYNDAVANTIMHELGHGLGLRHGGSTDVHRKPNYNSIMNYLFQFPGVDNNCTPAGNGVLNFSYGTRPNLNEASLNELVGVCGSPSSPWDWNGNGVLESGVARDLNNDQILQTLGDYNDWANLSFGGLSDVDGMSAAVEVVEEQPPPNP